MQEANITNNEVNCIMEPRILKVGEKVSGRCRDMELLPIIQIGALLALHPLKLWADWPEMEEDNACISPLLLPDQESS